MTRIDGCGWSGIHRRVFVGEICDPMPVRHDPHAGLLPLTAAPHPRA